MPLVNLQELAHKIELSITKGYSLLLEGVTENIELYFEPLLD